MRDFLGANYILLLDLAARCQVHLVCENISSCSLRICTPFSMYSSIQFYLLREKDEREKRLVAFPSYIKTWLCENHGSHLNQHIERSRTESPKARLNHCKVLETPLDLLFWK